MASLRPLAVTLALVLSAVGCTLRPDSYADPTLRWGGVDLGPELTSPAGTSGKVAGATLLKPTADAISLSSKAKPSADLYVAAARLSERSGKVAEAERHYQRALKINPRHAEALVGYARLKDREGEMAEATRLYQQAAKTHPNNASIFNDLGLCYARQRRFNESIAALERAVKLEPTKWRYRNNVAMVLVETGNIEAAVSHLKAVQGEAVAHYNVGYVLQKKGDSAAAARHFAKALQKNPSLAEARIWLEKLAPEPAAIAEPAPRIAADRQSEYGPLIPEPEPVGDRQDADAVEAMPPIAPQPPVPKEDRTAGAAQTTKPGLLPLPPDSRQPPQAAPSLKRLPAGPRFSNVAPLPPTSSVGQEPHDIKPADAGIRVVHPLPPVSQSE